MSATIATSISSDSTSLPSSVAVGYSYEPTAIDGAVRVHKLKVGGRGRKVEKAARPWRVVRRLRGLVIENQGESWLVGFEVNGELIEYELPAERLRKQGIKLRNQPFEMDEVVSVDPEVEAKGYRFRPLAGAEEAFVEELTLDPERKRLRDLIFAKFGKSKG